MTVVPPSISALGAYFLRLGALGFGGPAALTDRMRRDLVERRAWLTGDEFTMGLAIAASCPGPLAYQLAVFCGHVRHGVRGALTVAVAFALAPFVLVSAAAALYGSFGQHPVTRALFYGVGPVVLALVARACWHLGGRTLGRHPLSWAIAATGAVLIAVTGTEHLAFFLVAGVLGVAWLAPGGVGPPGERTAPVPAPSREWLRAGLPVVGAASASSLFSFFAKVGCLVFGSGLVIVPILRPAVVDQYRWLTEQQFVDAVAIGLISPGPVVITATFVGYVVGGLSGALAATAGMFAPAVAFTVVVAPLFRRHGAHRRVLGFVRGITSGVVGALAGTVPLIAGTVLLDDVTIAIALGGLWLLVRRWPDPLVVMLGGLAGVLVRA